MLAFRAIAARRGRNPQWSAAKLRVRFAPGNPVRDGIYEQAKGSVQPRASHHPSRLTAEWELLVRSLQRRSHNSKKGRRGLHAIHRTHVHTLVAHSDDFGAHGPPSVSIRP